MSRAGNGLRAVAILEAAKGVLVLIAAGAVAWLLHGRVQEGVEVLVRHFHMNPARNHPRVFQSMLDFGGAHAVALTVGAMLYAAIRFIEAYGLWRARRWAWGFGVLSAALYLPFELVELTRHISWAGLVVLVANVLIVFVLWHNRRNTV
jgi:uncharacterized membrane protein (DUF2068 family)